MFSDNLRSICVFSLVERRIYRTSASTSREIFRLARQAQVHFIRRRPRRICLACHAQNHAVRWRPRTISYRPPETVYTMTGPTGLRFSGGSAGKIRVRACALSRRGQNTRARVRVRVSVSLTAIEFSCRPPEAKNYLISSVGDQGIFVLACHAQKARVTTAPRPEHPG